MMRSDPVVLVDADQDVARIVGVGVLDRVVAGLADGEDDLARSRSPRARAAVSQAVNRRRRAESSSGRAGSSTSNRAASCVSRATSRATSSAGGPSAPTTTRRVDSIEMLSLFANTLARSSIPSSMLCPLRSIRPSVYMHERRRAGQADPLLRDVLGLRDAERRRAGAVESRDRVSIVVDQERRQSARRTRRSARACTGRS